VSAVAVMGLLCLLISVGDVRRLILLEFRIQGKVCGGGGDPHSSRTYFSDPA
jgi:hypothetical protein